MQNNRKNDHKVEREIALFLDENLYSNKEMFKEFARTDGREEQIHGSDIIVSTSDGKLDRKVVDEKVAYTYANSNLSTFSFELSFINSYGKKYPGWFIDSTKTTEYYLLGWVLKADIQYDTYKKKWDVFSIEKDNIKLLEWALVSREKIQKFLEKKGWTLERLSRQDTKIRENGGVATKEFIDEVSFRYGTYRNDRECPINILLKKETLLSLADYKGIISID